MPQPQIPASVFPFLRSLQKNNNRDWFNENKDRYQAEYAHMITFAEALHDEMSHYDQLVPETGKKILFRIYRDVRFSKNKDPYKTHFAGGLNRATKLLRGGYYFHIEPGGSFLGGGFWEPNSEDLGRIRREIAADDRPLRKIIADPVFVNTFGELRGDQLKTAPQGFAKGHPAIDLLRYKQFLLSRSFTDAEVTAPDFLATLTQGFRNMRPFFDYISEVLTTDDNGVPIE